jgi:phenylpropionate dioxygenase-like ring-hydroxylating dioxygenase large terminal subunit
MQTATELLRNFWYVATPAANLARGKTLPLKILGEEILFGRDKEGRVFALKDFCPHRGMPLRYGTFDGCEIECCYHGWKFNTSGQCTVVPSLVDDAKTDITKIKTGTYPCHEADGLVWIYMAESAKLQPTLPPPIMPAPIHGGFKVIDSVHMPCNVDHAVIGLMDPSHGPYVHKSWWWRTKKSMHEKSKQFAPREFGFRMVSHKPSSNSRAYRILGGSGERKTEIAFQLPGLRTEHITIGEKYVVLLTALTPVDERNTMLHQFFYTNIGIANALLPLLKIFGKAFIQQDVQIVKWQQEGLQEGHPPLMLLGDADAQALWYFRLKKEGLAATAEARTFENPLKERTLRWRS